MSADMNAKIESMRGKLPRRPVFRIEFTDDNVGYLNSKIGGSYFWPNNDVPDLQFLAQINLSELPGNDIFPKEGLLQFFIGDDDCYGLFKDHGGYMVVYHKDISNGIEAHKDFRGSPVLRVVGMSFEPSEESMTYSDFHFESYCPWPEDDYLSEKMYEEFCGAGSKVLGYPFFTQEDPRNDESHNVLLLQLDSDTGVMMWGDCGVANFFISEDALKKMDFSDVLYNWDCC